MRIASLCLFGIIISVSHIPLFADQYKNHRNLASNNLLELILAGKQVGIVNDDRVNVRLSSTLKADRIGQVNQGDIVEIYAENGTGRVEKGVWDYWYRIDAVDNRWVNALFVDKLPLQFLAKKPPHVFANPQNPETRVDMIRNTYDLVITRAPYVADRSKDRFLFEGKEDYWYYISDLSDLSSSILDDKWIHGSEIEPFLGSPCRRLEITGDPLLQSLPRVVTEESVTAHFGEPSSIENMGPEYQGFPPTVRYSYGPFFVDTLGWKSGRSPTLFRVAINSRVDRPFLKYGVNVGIHKDYLVECLGTPDQTKDEYWIYKYVEPLDNSLYVEMSGDQVSSIVWVAAVP